MLRNTLLRISGIIFLFVIVVLLRSSGIDEPLIDSSKAIEEASILSWIFYCASLAALLFLLFLIVKNIPSEDEHIPFYQRIKP